MVSIYVFSMPGDTISTFTLQDQPYEGISGLAYDPEDGNIWAAGAGPNYNECYYCKFKNDTSHSIVQYWQLLQGQYDVYDIGYPYYYENTDTIVAIDRNSPRVKMYNKDNGKCLGDFPGEPFGDKTYGIDINKNDKLTSYASGDDSLIIKVWDGYSWNKWANCDNYALGVAFGWNHIFVVHSSPKNTIWVFNLDGINVAQIKLNDWTSLLMYGSSRGRDDCVGKNDSLYITCFYPSKVVKEVEIGDYDSVIETTSVGDIKAIFH
jgi:hypothetical protein